jgi:Protein of unknown function (DUF1566)
MAMPTKPFGPSSSRSRPVRRFLVLAALIAIGLAAPAARATAPSGRYTITGGTVYDTKTKLTWEQAAPSTTYTQASASNYCSLLNLNGTGWRLPTMMELMTLLDYSVGFPGTTIDGAAFPSTPAGLFWTSTPLGTSTTTFWCVDFSQGGPTSDSASNSDYVRCVR